ncbi:unnamed protein product, partial [Protopolystoma xenopodis]
PWGASHNNKPDRTGTPETADKIRPDDPSGIPAIQVSGRVGVYLNASEYELISFDWLSKKARTVPLPTSSQSLQPPGRDPNGVSTCQLGPSGSWSQTGFVPYNSHAHSWRESLLQFIRHGRPMPICALPGSLAHLPHLRVHLLHAQLQSSRSRRSPLRVDLALCCARRRVARLALVLLLNQNGRRPLLLDPSNCSCSTAARPPYPLLETLAHTPPQFFAPSCLRFTDHLSHSLVSGEFNPHSL